MEISWDCNSACEFLYLAGDLDEARRLIDEGIDANVTDNEGKYPMHMAAYTSINNLISEFLFSSSIQYSLLMA